MLRLIFLLLSVFLITYRINAQTTSIDSITVEHHNVSGGGFQSDVTITDDGMTVYSSADVSGIFKSTDGGLLYENINEGLKSPKVASLTITPDNDQILYAGTGDKGGSGGLFRSIDGGDTWELTGAGNNAQFAGNHSASSDPVPNGHPRSNGDLIIVDQGLNSETFTDDVVIGGTYKNGVRLFTQGGDVEVSAVNTSGYVRSVAHNAAIPNKVYAAIHFSVNGTQNGIYEIDYSNPSAPISTLVYATSLPEGITVLSNGNVYAAIGKNGIVKYDGTSWSLQNAGLSTNNELRQWSAVTGYVNGTNDVVYAGLINLGGSSNGSNYSSIWRTENGGTSWTPLVDANNNVSDIIYGQSYAWWYRTKGFPAGGLGRTNSVVSSIEVALGASSNVSDDIIYVSGRGGIWKSDNGGNLWKPAVYNMQATSNRGVAVNPNNPSQIVLGNTDYVVLETSDSFQNSNISRDKPSGSESRGYDVIFDATSDELILGVGDRDTNNPGGGEVYIKSADNVGNPSDAGWLNTNLVGTTTSSNGRVRAVTYGYHDGNSTTSQTILAVVEEEGVFRYQNGVWSKSIGVSIGKTDRSNFVWPDNGNSGVVYLIDLLAGFYRSNDGGQSWSNIWPSMSFNNNDFLNIGYIAADDNDPKTVYLSIQGRSGNPYIGTGFRVYRMTGADSGEFLDPVTDASITDITKHSGIVAIKRPGPIVFGPNGKLWLTQQQNSASSAFAGLFVMENPKTDLSFTDLTTNAYRNIATAPSGIDVSSDGYVYISQNGVGVVKINVGVNEIPNSIPLANADIDQTVEANELVTLDGSGSSDADGNALTYLWTTLNDVLLSDVTAVTPTFTTPELATTTDFTFSLVVNDGEANSIADEVVITINASTLSITENQLNSNRVIIYPVPTKNEFIYIKSHNKTIGSVVVYDITGNAIIKKNITSTNGEINIGKLSSGIYIIKMLNRYIRFIVK